MSLKKLAKAIVDANSFVNKARESISNKSTINLDRSVDTTPTEKEKRLSEQPASFGSKIELQEEPSVEYLR